MFRAGLLIRSLPSILAELVSVCWYSYRTGRSEIAAPALIWLTSTVALLSFPASAILTPIRGGEVQLLGPVIAASVPIAMWIARELLSILMLLAGCILALLGRDPVDASL